MSEQVALSAYESEEVRDRVTELIEEGISADAAPHSLVLALWKMFVRKWVYDALVVARPPLVDALRRALAAVEDWKQIWAGRPLPSAPLDANEEEVQAAEIVAQDALGVDFYIFWLEIFRSFDPYSPLTEELERDMQRFKAEAENGYAQLVKDKEAAAPVGV